jgi:simple sugar transport system permease protein
MRDIFTFSLIASTIRLATPLVLAALGGLFSERSGVINIALEGKMLAGAFTAAALTHWVDTRLGAGAASPWIGLFGGMIAGLFLAVIYAVACIKFKADQVVSGAAINILMLGMPGLLSGAFFLSSGSTPQIPKDRLLPQSPAVIAFAVLALVALIWYVVYKTPFGLRLRSVGENPEAADAAGVSVSRIRYSGVLLAGILAGIGGAYLSIGQSSLFTRNMTAGRGFIALAALIFGKWRPLQTMLACLLFGFADALTIQLQGVPVSVLILRLGIFLFSFVILWFIAQLFVKQRWLAAVLSLALGVVVAIFGRYLTRGFDMVEIPVQFIQMIPYVVTIIVLAGFIGQSRAPKAIGIPYEKER